MADYITPNLGYIEPENGGSVNTWGEKLNENIGKQDVDIHARLLRSGDVMAGRLGVVAGTEAEPGVYISGDTDTGFYSPAPNNFGISTGGVGRFLLSNTLLALSVGLMVSGSTALAGLTVYGNATFGDAAGDTVTVNGALSYNHTLTGGTGIVNIGSGQIYKDALGNVAFGDTSIDDIATGYRTLSLKDVNGAGFRLYTGANENGRLYSDATGLYLQAVGAAIPWYAVVNNGVRLTIDPAGNAGLGVPPNAWNATFKAFQVNNASLWSSNNGNSYLTNNAFFNALDQYIYRSTGFATEYIQSAVNGSHAWYTAPVGTEGGAFSFTERLKLELAGHLLPGTTDNTQNIGSASNRWATVFAGTGTINTSDAREKTEVFKLTANEINAAKQLSKEIGTYKFLASVQAKGDDARTHIGMTVQRAIEIMEANNLNPFAYGFICHDVWQDEFVEHPEIQSLEAQDAVFDEDGNEITPAADAVEYRAAYTEQTKVAGDRYGFRYDQLNLFIAAGIEARITALEFA